MSELLLKSVVKLTCIDPAAQFRAAFVRFKKMIGLKSSSFVTCIVKGESKENLINLYVPHEIYFWHGLKN